MTIDDVTVGNEIVRALEESRKSLIARLQIVADAQYRLLWWAKAPDVPEDDIRNVPNEGEEGKADLAPKRTGSMDEFWALKAANPGCLLMFRMGDFFESFYDDAIAATGVLGIVLTNRGRHDGKKIPMCGVPVHRANEYFVRLNRAGFRVGMCERDVDGGWMVKAVGEDSPVN